jgi:hypothetical protein
MKDIQKTTYTVSDFLSWFKTDSLTLSPNFQRRSVWSNSAKSFFIDSILKNLPVPVILIRTQTNTVTLQSEREVVDGQQRLLTVLSFLEPEIFKSKYPKNKLKDNEVEFVINRTHNKEYHSKKFIELPDSAKRQILSYQFSVHVLPSDTEDREILEIFARMNATGVKIKEQELRNAEYHGEFKDCVYSLSYEYLDKWRDWKIFSESDIARMREVEEVSDIIDSILSNSVTRKNQAGLDSRYKEKEEIFKERTVIEDRFRIVMKTIEEVFGNQIAESKFNQRAWFYSFFLFFYDYLFGLQSDFHKIPPTKIKDKQALGDKLSKINNAIKDQNLTPSMKKNLRGATTTKEAREEKVAFLKEQVLAD